MQKNKAFYDTFVPLLQTLKTYEKDGWLRYSKHETLPLTIWCYTEQTQYDRKWDNITLNTRSLITDDTGRIIASSFPKFFNWANQVLRHLKIYRTLSYKKI